MTPARADDEPVAGREPKRNDGLADTSDETPGTVVERAAYDR